MKRIRLNEVKLSLSIDIIVNNQKYLNEENCVRIAKGLSLFEFISIFILLKYSNVIKVSITKC